MNLQDAKMAAAEILAAVEEFCEPQKLTVAGSIRREVRSVGDIEIICIPIQSRFSAFVSALKTQLRIQNKSISRRSRYLHGAKTTVSGSRIEVDVFMPMPYDWGRILAIRTGSAKYSEQLARKWRERGFVGTEHGLIPEQHCYRSGDSWKLNIGVSPELVRCTFESEIDFFNFLGLPYLDPIQRNL